MARLGLKNLKQAGKNFFAKVSTLLRRVLIGAPDELLGSIPGLNFSSLMSAIGTTIQPAGTKPLNIDILCG